jgi:starch-binding outer membrane protein, SusD/RagB family
MTFKYRFDKIKVTLFLLLCMLGLLGCKRIIAIEPPVNTVNEQNVYKADVTATAVLTGMYSGMIGNATGTAFNGAGGLSVLTGLSSDELTLYNGVADNKLIAYYKNALLAASQFNNYGAEFWGGLYSYIFICNAAIEGLNKSVSLTPSIKQQLLGEARFMRAFFYFYLVNLYGDMPLTLTTDPAINAVLSRTDQRQVYQQIIEDLKEAESLLSASFLDGSLSPYSGAVERVRPSKWAAAALLARAYLYYGNFTGDISNYAYAETQATNIINNTSFFDLPALNGIFIKNSREAIWQIQPVAPERNTEDGFTFILPQSGPNGYLNPVYLSNNLLNSFEVGDLRKSEWVSSITPVTGTATYYFPYKYKSTTTTGSATEYLMILRLAEQYLIRAEARVQQNNIDGAKTDLNAVRNRAGLLNTTASDKTEMMAAVLHERQVELFTELGHRWFDLKRTKSVDMVMNSVTPIKGGTWQTTDQLYPIPVADIIRNPKLIQNLGY